MKHKTKDLKERWDKWMPVLPFDGQQLETAVYLASDLGDAVIERDDLLKRFYEAMAMGPLDAAATHGPDFDLEQYQHDVAEEVRDHLNETFPLSITGDYHGHKG